jgi:hypothetical protein
MSERERERERGREFWVLKARVGALILFLSFFRSSSSTRSSNTQSPRKKTKRKSDKQTALSSSFQI